MLMQQFRLAHCGKSAACAYRRVSTASAASLNRPVQTYISHSRDPFLNLSIEHYLLQESHGDSSVLFLYTNRPCVVIGRNQNPWLEVNLSLLRVATDEREDESDLQTIRGFGDVDLVRRRSGGGTVFHDEGNVNWTVISPSASFTRDKHAEMVVRGLRSSGVQRCRVNERHDIVLDQNASSFDGTWGPGQDTHSTPWQGTGPGSHRPLKVSGSAYKLTRGRALHHGTCLLSSPNLNIIPHYLHSPAKGFIRGRGVESVSSPVGNLNLSNEDFIEATQKQFLAMYDTAECPADPVDEAWLDIEEVKRGYDELKSADWNYVQTPQFDISNIPFDRVGKQPSIKPNMAQINLTVRHGEVAETNVGFTDIPADFKHSLGEVLKGRKVHEIRDWRALFNRAGLGSVQSNAFAQWLQNMLPTPSGHGFKEHRLPSGGWKGLLETTAP